MDTIKYPESNLTNVHHVRMPKREPLTKVVTEQFKKITRFGRERKAHNLEAWRYVEKQDEIADLLIQASLRDYSLYPWQLKGSGTFLALVADYLRFEIILDNQVFEDKNTGFIVLKSFSAIPSSIPKTKAEFMAVQYQLRDGNRNVVHIGDEFAGALYLCKHSHLSYSEANIRLVSSFKKAGLGTARRYYLNVLDVRQQLNQEQESGRLHRVPCEFTVEVNQE